MSYNFKIVSDRSESVVASRASKRGSNKSALRLAVEQAVEQMDRNSEQFIDFTNLTEKEASRFSTFANEFNQSQPTSGGFRFGVRKATDPDNNDRFAVTLQYTRTDKRQRNAAK